jgi:hypothetical protein
MSCASHSDRSLLSAILSTIVLMTVLGCSREPRTSISGNVTFDGQPLAVGQIVFEPMSAGRLGIAQISNGAYNMPAAQGPTAGKYVVRITANRPTGGKVKAGRGSDSATMVDQYEQFIPAKFNDQSQLITEVAGEGTIVRDFTLSAK